MYIQRSLEKAILSATSQYPVVTLLGPRQSGKSTIAQHLFPQKMYINLEYPGDRERICSDPRRFLSAIPMEGVIIDEIQRAPELLSYIQGYTDARPDEVGRFILTGSHQLELHGALTQSLAGRTALITVLPLSLEEIESQERGLSLEELLYRGGYPKIHGKKELDVRRYYQQYLATYVEKDLRQMIAVKDLSLFYKFLTLLASRVGQLIDYHGISSDLGISANTIKQWCSVLQASFIIFELPPYFENIGKRLIRSPKIYFFDTGLLCALLGFSSAKDVERHPLRGGLFENMVILDLLKSSYNNWLRPECYFYRDSGQHEVDLLWRKGIDWVPIEIKSSETFQSGFFKQLDYLHTVIPEKIRGGVVVYSGQSGGVKEYELLNYREASQWARKE